MQKSLRWLIGILALTVVVYPLLIGLAAFWNPLFWLGTSLLGFTVLYGFYGNASLSWNIPVYGLYCPLLLLYLFVMVVLVPLNYPPAQPAEDSAMYPEPATTEAEANFDRLNEHFQTWRDQFDSQIQTVTSTHSVTQEDLEQMVSELKMTKSTRLLAKKTEPARETLIEFIITEPFALPEEDWATSGGPKMERYILMNNLGLVSIIAELQNGNHSVASQQFKKLWKANIELNRLPGSQLQLMVASIVTSNMIDFYGRHPDLRKGLDESFVDKINEARKMVSSAGQRAIAGEYLSLKDGIQIMKQHDVRWSISSPKTILWNFTRYWPLYDPNRTVGYIHDYYARIQYFIPKHYHEIQSELARFQSKWNNQSQILSVLRPANLIINPMGRFLFEQVIPNAPEWVFDNARLRSRLTMARFAGTHSPPFNPNEIPTDELTGQPYEVDTSSDSYVIRSPYSGKFAREPIELLVKTEK